ncbi:hypothetical protein EDD11_002223 [Mortierella claussenii]|nr:hypothetical protein EDD11_002223 [Mortierella claussenii]
MSSTSKDTKALETDAHAPSDLNELDNSESPVTLAVTDTTTETTAAKKPPGSPQTAAEDSFQTNENDNNLEAHPAVPYSTFSTATESTPVAAVPASTSLPAASPDAAVVTSTPIAPPTNTPTQTPTAPAVSEREAKLTILTEAFPTVEKEVCEFVLESHRGNVEASINALLEISDPEFQPEPQQPTAAPATASAGPAATHTDMPPALPRRQDHDDLAQGVNNLNLGQNQQPQELDPVFLASTSTPEQQLRADEDFARTLAAMDEYRARDRQNIRNQQGQQQHQQDEGPSFATEIKELMDEELPKIKERFNVAADTTKKKVTEWYNQFKANRAEAAQRNSVNQGQYSDGYRAQQSNDHWSGQTDREPIRFGSRLDEDEPLARNRVTPPLGGGDSTPPLPSRPYNVSGETTAPSTTEPVSTSTNPRRTTLEDELDIAMNAQPAARRI